MLLEKAVVIESPTGLSCVHWLCQSKSPVIARMMIGRGVDLARVGATNGETFHYRWVHAADDGSAIEILRMLVGAGWNLNQPTGPGQSTILGEYLESITRPVAVIRWLIENGADLGKRTVDGEETILEALRQRPRLRKLAGELRELIDDYITLSEKRRS
jgi:hypothetical protein